jgi:hypothetical protein
MANIKLTSPTGKLFKCQKAFRINKTRTQEGVTDVRVSDIFKNDILAAAKNLNGVAFKIYMYLISNQENYIGGLSRADITTKLGISSKSYDNGIAELEEKGYFKNTQIRVSDSNGEETGLWDFYARPNP